MNSNFQINAVTEEAKLVVCTWERKNLPYVPYLTALQEQCLCCACFLQSYKISTKDPLKKCETLTLLKYLSLSEVRISSIMFYETREDALENREERIIQKPFLNWIRCGGTALVLLRTM